MRIGKKRDQVVLEWWQKGERTASGATPEGWQPGARLWAEVEQLRGRTLFEAQKANAETTARIRLRYRADIAAATGKTLRLRHGEITYRLEGRPIDVGGKRTELELMCHEWV
ncbi:MULTISPECIES: phage head closure protein [unclassified Halomonas]|uniref:phage head closure protein n=1 Tax=unclassified Halomonas TaxID=2609666 RepID=UPI0020A02FAE|nr:MULTISPECIES: phage head closure protein [unclassified Halomonas]MCP1314387.1 phage head closure protein [Halomonas sp. 707D7]MCP1326058.1 phage head closure protein [Halomonas sp. 707D4]